MRRILWLLLICFCHAFPAGAQESPHQAFLRVEKGTATNLARMEATLEAHPYSACDLPDGLPELAEDAGQLAAFEIWVARMHTQYPECFRYEYYLGDIACAHHRESEAQSHFAAALRLDPQQPECWRALGLQLQRLHGTAAALPAYRKAFYLAPQDSVMRAQYGEALQRLRLHHEAIAVFALGHDDDEAQSYVSLGYGDLMPEVRNDLSWSLRHGRGLSVSEPVPTVTLEKLDRCRGQVDWVVWHRARILAWQRAGHYQAAGHALADFLQERPADEQWAWDEVAALSRHPEARPALRQRVQQIVELEPGNQAAREALERLEE